MRKRARRFELLKKYALSFTDKGKGRGIRCDLSIYMYPDGHSRFNVKRKGKKEISLPNHDLFGAFVVLMDILKVMHRKSKRKQKIGRK